MNAQEIITKAFFNLINKKDYDSISITDICKEAGYTRMSFYRAFSSKEDILSKSFSTKLKEFTDNNNITDQLSILFRFYNSNKDLINAIYKSNKQYLIIDSLLDKFNYNNLDNKEMQYSVSFIVYTFYSFLDTWYKRGMIETEEEIQSIMSKNSEK